MQAGVPEVERIPLGFKTEIGGQVVLFKLLIELLLLWYQVSDQSSQVNMLKRGWATMRELISGPACMLSQKWKCGYPLLTLSDC
jgi:hypothetical protein